MDKEEILEKSRKENQNKDLVEAAAMAKTNQIAISVGILACGVLEVLHAIFRETVDYGIWSVYFTMLSTTMLVKYAKLRHRHELLLGLLYTAFTVMFFVFYVLDLVKKV